MLPTEQQTKPFLRHCLQQFTALFISVNTIFLHNTPFDETTKIAKYSQKSHSNAFQLFSKHRNDLTPFKLFPRLILFQLIQPVDNLLQHCRSNGLFNIGILFPVSGLCPSPHRLSALSACKGIKVIVSVPHTVPKSKLFSLPLWNRFSSPEVLPVSPPEPLRRSHIPELRLSPFLFLCVLEYRLTEVSADTRVE